MSSLRNYCNISSYDSTGKQLRYIDSNEANRKVTEGSWERFCISCGKVSGEGPCLSAGNHIIALRQIAPEEMDDSKLKAGGESDSSLTRRDMDRNVGITENVGADRGEKDVPANADQVRQSQRRVRNQAWASLHNRSVTVVPKMAA